MKKTIITTLKFEKNQVVFEAVEQVSELILPIYSNVIEGQTFSSNELERFVKSSKEALETIIKGKISEVIIMVASDINENLKIENYAFSKKNLTKNLLASEIEFEKEIINEFELKEKVIVKNKTISKIVKNNTLTLIKNIAYLESNFVKLVNKITAQNHLNIAKFYILEELRMFKQNAENENKVFVELNEGYLKFDLFLGKSLLKSHIVFNGINQIRSKIITKNQTNLTLANMLLKSNDDIKRSLTLSDLDVDVQNAFSDYLETLLAEYKTFLSQNSLKNSNQELNFYQNSWAEVFQNLSVTRKNLKINIALENCDFISQEMQGLVEVLTKNIEKKNLKKFITTEIFIIDSMLNDQKTNRRNTLFI